MTCPIEIKEVDRKFYRENLAEFLPDEIIDIHTHIWLKELRGDRLEDSKRTVKWPKRVAADGPVDELLSSYEEMFPGKKVLPMVFSTVPGTSDLDGLNEYVGKAAAENRLPALLFSNPAWSVEKLESQLETFSWLGVKSYLSLAPSYLLTSEIRIFDFFPPAQLDILNRRKAVVMLHIPRNGRFKDPVNLGQLLEIEERWPDITLIVAHVGRAYCNEDLGDAFEVLSSTRNMLFDFSANTNQWVFERMIEAVGPKRILFGSDMPITRMRTRRIVENGKYINLVPKGLYGDVSTDPHMRELSGVEAEELTFFLYEEIAAFKRAAENQGLSAEDVADIFYNNAKKIIQGAE